MSKNIFAPIWVKKDIFHRKFDDDGYQQFVVCLFYSYYVNNIEFYCLQLDSYIGFCKLSVWCENVLMYELMTKPDMYLNMFTICHSHSIEVELLVFCRLADASIATTNTHISCSVNPFRSGSREI